MPGNLYRLPPRLPTEKGLRGGSLRRLLVMRAGQDADSQVRHSLEGGPYSLSHTHTPTSCPLSDARPLSSLGHTNMGHRHRGTYRNTQAQRGQMAMQWQQCQRSAWESQPGHCAAERGGGRIWVCLAPHTSLCLRAEVAGRGVGSVSHRASVMDTHLQGQPCSWPHPLPDPAPHPWPHHSP